MKLSTILAAVTLAFGIAACGNDKSAAKPPEAAASTGKSNTGDAAMDRVLNQIPEPRSVKKKE